MKDLPLKKYPNGLFYQTNKHDSYMIHYNYLVGHSKKEMMIKDNHWFFININKIYYIYKYACSTS